ncbi:MAG: hypothetical protein IPK35_09255 [Saprospiraceae bacterium]|nr:hypothetical protein [Saprospiraceae bacterium]
MKNIIFTLALVVMIMFQMKGKSVVISSQNLHPCNDAGSYFIPDFVALKVTKDDKGKDIFDIIVINAKLTKDTDFTSNQKNARQKGAYTMRSESKEVEVNGQKINLVQGVTEFSKSGDFIKIFSDGNGVGVD